MSFSHQKKRKRGSKRSHDICGTKEPEPDEFHIQPTKKRRQSGESSLACGRRGFANTSSSSIPTRVMKKQSRKRPPIPLNLEEIEQRKRQTEQDIAVLSNGGVVNVYIHPPFNGDRNYQNFRKTEHRPGSGIPPLGVGLGLHKSGVCHDRDNWNNPHYARGTLHDVLDADSYKLCDKIAREILKQNASDVIVNVYMKSNLIGCIFSSLESENEATRLTATLLSVLPYVRGNPNNNRHGIRRVSDLIRKNPQLDLMLQHLSMGLRQPLKTVSSHMKTWIVHALADIMECLYDATKSRASQPEPITVRYRLIEPALQIMLCPHASPMVQAFATRLLTTHIHYGPDCRKELVRLSALGIVTGRLPLLPDEMAKRKQQQSPGLLASPSPCASCQDGSSGGVPTSEDGKDREPSCSSSNPEEEQDDDKSVHENLMGYYLHTLIMKFCYIAYSHEEFFLADDPTDYIPIDHQGNPTHDSRVHAARNAPPGGVFTQDVVSCLRDKCERLSSRSTFYEVRAAAKLLLTYSLGARAGIRRPVETKDPSCRDSRDVGRRVQLRSPKWELKFTDLCEEERACMEVDVDPFMSTQHTNRSKRKR